MDNDMDELTVTQNSYYADFEPSKFSWLYIAIDIRDMSMAKIGLTTKATLERRIAEGKTYNPFLVLFATYELSRCTFGVSVKELNDIEQYIHNRFRNPVKHLYTGRNSKWFYVAPEDAESQIDWYLAKRAFSVDNGPLYTFWEGENNRHGVDIEQMKKIKRIYRPFPVNFDIMARDAGMEFVHYADYYDYLEEYHSRSAGDKVYL